MTTITSTPAKLGTTLLAAAVLIVLLLATGRAVSQFQLTSSAPTQPTHPAAHGHQIVLSYADQHVQATLDDTAAGRAFTARLPLSLDLNDAMGQARLAILDRPLDVTGAPTVTRPITGGLYYEPETGQLAIFYDSLDQQVPAPGLVKLGTITSPTTTFAIDRWTKVDLASAD